MSDGQAQIWRVGAIMNEPLREVLKFCAWYLALGAEEVVICFDNPEDPALTLLQDHPRLRCIACTPEFWAAVGSDAQERFVLRQNAALSWVYQQYDSGWLLNVDADEFLFLEGRSVAAFLAGVPEARHSARIVTAERILVAREDGNTYFRRPMAYELRKAVYGEDVALFGPRRAGLVGHPQGKSIIRCGVPGLRLRQHWPVWRGRRARRSWITTRARIFCI
ncbi:glycosyltransferase family 2 protein [Phaeobacter sp. HF9A]|uniref:glycosyltransferase family 2 protein n=1 Tax=Phaeobacter sp. HF9A TaxID=2721561 RepID=UPI0020CA9943|nr:glycosyltransferase family 2 protein [Phaeobacter sp. HF9A]